MQLVNLIAPRDGSCLGVIVEHLPSGTRRARAGRATVAPDGTVAVKLEELLACGDDCGRGRVHVKFLPAGAGGTRTRRASVAPDGAIVV